MRFGTEAVMRRTDIGALTSLLSKAFTNAAKAKGTPLDQASATRRAPAPAVLLGGDLADGTQRRPAVPTDGEGHGGGDGDAQGQAFNVRV